MTLQDEVEVRRTSVRTKVLMVGCGVLAVLGSFWTIVWFIRLYVEAPAWRRWRLRHARARRRQHHRPDVDHHPGPGTTARQSASSTCQPRLKRHQVQPRVTDAISDRLDAGDAAACGRGRSPPKPKQARPPPAAPADARYEVGRGARLPQFAAPPLPRPKPTQTAAVRRATRIRRCRRPRPGWVPHRRACGPRCPSNRRPLPQQ